MSRELHLFALWALAILTVAVAVILYQHATHTNAILGFMKSGVRPLASAVSSDPDIHGAQSRASGVWTPLGPISAITGRIASIMPYQPTIGGTSTL